MLVFLFISVLQVSITSGIIILALTAFSSKLNENFTVRWKFWVWLLLAARLPIPVSFSIPRAPVRLPVSDAPVLSLSGQIPHMSLSSTSAQSLTVVEVAALVWLAGVILFLLYNIIVYNVCKRKILRWSHAPKDGTLISALNDMRFAVGISKRIPLLISPRISSPMIIGIFKSYLLLPTEDYTPTELHYIVKHELIHIKRRDIWYKLLLLCANAAHWFNPAVYLMVSEAGKDLELACDEEVVKGLTFDNKIEYSDIILKSVHRQSLRGMVPAVCFYSGADTIKARFCNILSKNNKRAGVFPGVAVVLCVFLASTLIACERTGLVQIPDVQSTLEYYQITSGLEKFPVDDIFLSLHPSAGKDVKTTAAWYIEDIALQNNLTLPDYFDQYFFIRKLKDEDELERLKEQGLADNRSQLHTVYGKTN